MPPRRKVKPLSDEHAALGAAIRELREEAGLTQEELAERVGTTFTRIGLLERGAVDPRFTTLSRVAKGLGVGMVRLSERFERALETADTPLGA